MKNKLLLIFLAVIMLSNLSYAQLNKELSDAKYRRSSLHTILIETESFPEKETVISAYNNAEFPNKYNDHNIGEKSINLANYELTDDDRIEAGINKSKFGKMGASLMSDLTSGIADSLSADYPLIINKYFNEKKIANQLVAKWFDRQEDGSFDMNLISERGQYDATALKADEAKGSAKGVSLLSDAGEELIDKTFVVVSKLNYISNEVVALPIYLALVKSFENSNPLVKLAGEKAAKKVYEKTREGYSVWTTSYLYKLKWNDSISAVFYNDLWVDKNSLNSNRKEAFDNSNLFELEYIGSEKSSSLVTFSLKEKRTEEQIIALSTVRNVDAVFAKLQKKYDVFKPKVPLLTGFPITAKIGMKEGLEEGDKFEVLEQTQDPDTGKTKYVRKGIIKVEKKLLWDNRFNAFDNSEEISTIDYTTFSGGKDYYPGMLIRQIN
ncbi:hypothetical protein [Lutibacter sp.]|uniref:hypothetical protein n=1 Tax=Lutibacter sp. TaxID=1925666 RepID=UPI003567213B